MDSSTSATSLASLPVRLLPLQLTPSGRPVLLPGEAERLIHDRADLVFVPTPEEEKERDDSSSLRFPRSLEDGVLRGLGLGFHFLQLGTGDGGGELLFHGGLAGPGFFVGGLAEVAIGDEQHGFLGRLFHGEKGTANQTDAPEKAKEENKKASPRVRAGSETL